MDRSCRSPGIDEKFVQNLFSQLEMIYLSVNVRIILMLVVGNKEATGSGLRINKRPL